MVFVAETFEEVVIVGEGNLILDAAKMLELADSLLDKSTSVSTLEALTRAAGGGSTSSGCSETSWHRTEEVSWHVRSSREEILRLACDIAFREGFSSVQWKRNFSALHLAAKLGSLEFVRRLLQEANAISGLALRDDYGKLPIEYALALPEVDLQLLELLDPMQASNATAITHVPICRKAPAATARPRQERARRAASEPRLKKASAKLPPVLEGSLLEPYTHPKTKGVDVGRQSRAHNGLPTLLGSHGLARQVPKARHIPGQLLAREVCNGGQNTA